MCGIAGIVGRGSQGGERESLKAMVRALERRGPDGEGMESWPNAHLGHRRLAILDLSPAGHQPMLSDDRSIGVVFNGCIYNFMEIRRELEQHGHRFRSNCDTEVLVRGYQQWGIDALVPRLRGMFAFAVWDDQNQTLCLVRDRLGVKPLVYAEANGRIAFASTIPALRKGGFAGEVNPKAVLELLEYAFITEDCTIYKEASKLPPAGVLVWKDGKSALRRYWELPEADEPSRIRFEDAVEETERLLVEAVKLRLISDVPIGALLSGGIDSTLVCWAMSKLAANITAFTVSTPGDPADEAPATQVTAQLLGIPHQIITLPPEGQGMMDALVSAFSEPLGSYSALAMLEVSEAVRPHATVLLTGDGGDDVFVGYSFQKDYFRIQRLARFVPEFAGPAWRAVRPLVEAIPALRRPKNLINYLTGGLPELARARYGVEYLEDRGMIGPRLAGLEIDQRKMPPSAASARRLLADYMRYEQSMWLPSEFMPKVDGATMYHALEARSPLFDQKIWEFASSLPLSLRLHGGELKAVLREIVRRQVSPEVAVRKKQGFTIPIEKWLVGKWGKLLDGMLESKRLERDGWLQRGTLEKAIAEARSKGEASLPLWSLAVFENWLNKHGAAG